MTDTWDELWETMPVVVYGLRGGKSTHVDWLNKVKAEGDRLQKEGLEHHAIAVAYYEKLEAIKNHITPQNLSTYGLNLRVGTRANINSKDLHAFLGDLSEILEAEGVE